MIIAKNPNPQKLEELISLSSHKAAKWIEDPEDNSKYFWPSDSAFHADVAKILHIPVFEKGIAV